MKTDLTDPRAVYNALQSLASELETRRFAVRLRTTKGRAPHLIVINPEAPVLTENVLVAPDSEGAWSYWFPWPERIALVTDVGYAADRIENVLAEVGR
ncbi:hypothetical protein [Sphaerimonospora thailandensis]|uniref:Uncharacterized protein n=1 Tax=Sphaerimonospora thailandensis TaxID=795644 RepID=A0A8J3W258_9ACTN|nr:hypothetical protein [Sphaerimonospora thailandensis]GIH72828.1 hypothetical protein Mth01_50810 [Sphaerimonospora thailandensis]